uniref:Retrotransposon protein, putative, unclassified n=1 Tax=Oryza sativa subsp. japonica TaxID=39947 RepID=Q2QT11_ORYSJ|nr:retrotransposon protein, putative, unclassified [Oryza sativa Japonica Group]
MFAGGGHRHGGAAAERGKGSGETKRRSTAHPGSTATTETATGAEEGGGAARVDGVDGAPAVGDRNGGVDEVGENAAKPKEAAPRWEVVRGDDGGGPELGGDGGERERRRELDSDGEKGWPFPRGQGGYKFLFVVIDKFTKWIEAEPTREIKADNAIKFIKGIFCRYGLPHRILMDNGSQFTSGDFQDYCIELGVKICFASVSHPQSNGQVERANGIVLRGIKTRVHDRLMAYDKKLVEELSSVLWAVQTTLTTSNKKTPFFLVYGSEAMLPTELRHQSTREHRERVAIRAAAYQQALRRYHEKRIRARTLTIGDYVLRRVQNQAGRNKLSPEWEGPYPVERVLRPGAFKIADGDVRELSNSWNIDQLRKFYV